MSDEPQEEVSEPSPEEMDKDHIYVNLSKPISAYGNEVSVIKMRIPTAADGIRVGNPIDFFPNTEPLQIRPNLALVQAMVARLANIPSGSIEKMASQDLVACGWRLAPFFLPPVGT